MSEIKICCDCGNFILGKANYVMEDFESRSPYCLICWTDGVEEQLNQSGYSITDSTAPENRRLLETLENL